MLPKAAGGSPETMALPGEGEVLWQLTERQRHGALLCAAPPPPWHTGPLGGALWLLAFHIPFVGTGQSRQKETDTAWLLLGCEVHIWQRTSFLSWVCCWIGGLKCHQPLHWGEALFRPTDHHQTQTVSWVGVSGTCKSSCRSQEASCACSVPNHQPADLYRAAGKAPHHSNGLIQTFLLWDNRLNFEFLRLCWLLALMFLNSFLSVPWEKMHGLI